jgi:GTPase
VERCAILVHLIDIAPVDESDPVENYRLIEAELAAYSPTLAQKPRWIVISKCDLADEVLRDDVVQRLEKSLGETSEEGSRPPITLLSSASSEGIKSFIDKLGDRVREERAVQEELAVQSLTDAPTKAGKKPLNKTSPEDELGHGEDDEGVDCVWVP